MYQIRWDSNEAVWFDHKEKPYSVLVSADWDMNIDDVYACDQIHQELAEQEEQKMQRQWKYWKGKMKNKKWVCDLRFKGQVVTYQVLE